MHSEVPKMMLKVAMKLLTFFDDYRLKKGKLLRISDLRLDICILPKVEGTCRTGIRNFYHNTETKKSEEFIYGGCDGNENRFDTMEECAKACTKDKKLENLSSSIWIQTMSERLPIDRRGASRLNKIWCGKGYPWA